jgi:hypothetical protein
MRLAPGTRLGTYEVTAAAESPSSLERLTKDIAAVLRSRSG